MRKLTRNQWAAVGTGFVLVAAAGFGLSAINQTEPVPQTAEEPSAVVEETAPVDVNQNAPSKTTANTDQPLPETAQAEVEDLAEAPVEEAPITAKAEMGETAGMTGKLGWTMPKRPPCMTPHWNSIAPMIPWPS